MKQKTCALILLWLLISVGCSYWFIYGGEYSLLFQGELEDLDSDLIVEQNVHNDTTDALSSLTLSNDSDSTTNPANLDKTAEAINAIESADETPSEADKSESDQIQTATNPFLVDHCRNAIIEHDHVELTGQITDKAETCSSFNGFYTRESLDAYNQSMCGWKGNQIRYGIISFSRTLFVMLMITNSDDAL